ncbi:MAG TPA: trehalose-6-phosphate synthase, partial [Verrucomicrobiae bacterium]|nr:trehalose-6-phosphate synthase [Verrucomicrobiae bacterium]
MRLVIVSNRLPFTVSMTDGKPAFESSSGGLTTGLWSYLEKNRAGSGEPFDFLWMGWPGRTIEPEHIPEVEAHAQRFHAAPVYLSEESADRFYHGFCNKTL